MATFVLVSGSWHAAWCWEWLTPLLEAGGHRVLAPDLAGMGRDPTPRAQVTLALWADQIADLIRAASEPVILVGHSRGGIVISEAAERVPDRIRKLVYLAAVLVPDGTSVAAVRAAKSRIVRRHRLEDIIIPGPDNTSTVRPEAIDGMFFNTTPPELAEYGRSRMGPEPMAAMTTPLRLTGDRYGRVPRAYIECARDQSLPLQLQRSMQAGLPCDPVILLDTDHSPFLSNPDALAAALVAIAEGVSAEALDRDPP